MDTLEAKSSSKNNADKLFAALKMIEALYVQGEIEQHVWVNILNEYRNTVDITGFKCYDTYLKKG